MRKQLLRLPMFLGDMIRFSVELLVNVAAVLAAALVFVVLWRNGILWQRMVAFPAAYIVFSATFFALFVLLRLILLRNVKPGSYRLDQPEVLRWILADGLWRMLHRSPVSHWITDFGPQRWLFYRLMGAEVDHTFYTGWGAKILDPWSLQVGRDVVIGANAVICGHVLVGKTVFIGSVKIGSRATVGVGAVIFPGVEIGEDAIVGAGAFVPKNTVIPPGEVWGGVPARKISTVSEEEPAGERSRQES